MRSLTTKPLRLRAAFTLIELLVVMAILSVLLSITLSVMATCKKTFARTQSKLQFAQYALALQAYRLEYGHYPLFLLEKGEGVPTNLADCSPLFIQALSGSKCSGKLTTAASQPLDYNPKKIAFYAFSARERGDRDESGNFQLVDAFGNPNIYVLLDPSGTGSIDASEVPQLQEDCILQSVVVFSLQSDNKPGTSYQDVFSWK